jgi:4-amino-4-deoxy-L-arabinose transferase-like glycosyltransferase
LVEGRRSFQGLIARVAAMPRLGFMVALVAFIVHGAAVLFLPGKLDSSPDFFSFYRPLAEELAAGRGLQLPDGAVPHRYPPGFSIIFASALLLFRPFGLGDAAILGLFVVGAATSSVWLLFWLGRRLGGPGTGLLAAGLWLIYPPWLWLAKQANSELVFLPFLFLALGVWQNALDRSCRRQAFLAGLLVGAGALIRPAALLLALPLALGAWRRPFDRRQVALIALLCAGQMAATLPWILWSSNKVGRFMPLSSAGVLALHDGLSIGVEADEPAPMVPRRVAKLFDEIWKVRRDLFTTGKIFAFLGRQTLEDPLTMAQLLAWKAARGLYGTESTRFENALLAIQGVWLGLAAWAFFGLGRRPGVAMPGVATIVWTVLYFWGMTVMVLPILRYMMPAMALLSLVIGRRLARTSSS